MQCQVTHDLVTSNHYKAFSIESIENCILRHVLVTGGAGFVGSHLVRRLSRLKNYKITVVDDLSSGSKKRLSGLDIAFYGKDIRDKKAISRIIEKEKIDTCVHLAAKISVQESMIRPEDTFSVNVDGTLAVLEACRGRVENFIFASSAAVYGHPKILPLPEEQPLVPISPYGASKVAGEALVFAYNNSHMIPSAIVLRFFNVYGNGQSPAYAGVITRFFERLSKGQAPIIFGDGSQTRDFVFIDDVIDAILLSMSAKGSGIFNIGTGEPISLNELAAKLIKILGFSSQPIYRKRIEGDILHSYADTRKANNELGFIAKKDIENGLRELVAGLSS